MTPNGTLLQGKYRESYCVIHLGERDDGERDDGERDDGERDDGERDDGELANFLVATL